MKKILSLKNCKLKTIKIGLKIKFNRTFIFQNLNKKRKIKIFDPGLTYINSKKMKTNL